MSNALRQLVPFAPFEKSEKQPWRKVTCGRVPYQIAQSIIYGIGF